jgi:hypothetical protein
VLTRLSDEDDGADTLDLHAGGVSKLDGASDIRVKLSEELSSTGHVMGDAGVEAPPVSLIVARAVAEEGVCSRLIKVKESRCGDATGDNWMLVCARSIAGSSSSTCATLAWPRRGCQYSLAQWLSLPQLWQTSSHAGFWLLAAPS